MNLNEPRAIHVVGIGGAGMSAIATVLARMGHRVSGSDLRRSAVLDRLALRGIAVFAGHRAEHVPRHAEAVVVSTAIPADNPEVVEATARAIPVLRRADLLRMITEVYRTIAVTGTHGKTTTSSMLALILREAGWRPSFIIGGEVNEVGANAVWDEGEWLVVEADESDGTFVQLRYEAALITSVEPDHLEYWNGFDPLVDAFGRFADASTGPVVACADDPMAAPLAPVTYGFAEEATYRVTRFEPRSQGCAFRIDGPRSSGAVELPVPGRHNALNAAGAAALAAELGVPFDAAATALGRFAGVARRFQFRGEVDGRTVVDDYAHLPSEVRAVVETARDGPWGRVVAVFQPHRYSRTATLGRDFAGSFDAADVVVLTDVYAAGETPRPGVSGRVVLDAVLDAASEASGPKRIVYLPSRPDLPRHLSGLTRRGDIVLTLGAGDIANLADEWRSAGRG